MLMCSRCKKRPAVVFISQMNAKDPQHKKNEGLCLVCAKELGISQVDDYMKAMGISDDDLEAMSNQLMEASDGDDFEPGGTNFLSNLFGGDAANLFSNLAGGMPKATDEGGENKPKDKKKKLRTFSGGMLRRVAQILLRKQERASLITLWAEIRRYQELSISCQDVRRTTHAL